MHSNIFLIASVGFICLFDNYRITNKHFACLLCYPLKQLLSPKLKINYIGPMSPKSDVQLRPKICLKEADPVEIHKSKLVNLKGKLDR